MQGQGRGSAPGTGGGGRGGGGGGSSSGSYGGHIGSEFAYGMNYYPSSVPEDYGYGYGYWGFGLPLPPPPPLPRTLVHGRGITPRPSMLLGVQGGGVLKRNSQGYFDHGRGHARGYGNSRFPLGGRGGKNLTKEALDADLDEWRLKDKRFAGQSLDAELDDYWNKKDTSEENKGDVVKGVDATECSPKKQAEVV